MIIILRHYCPIGSNAMADNCYRQITAMVIFYLSFSEEYLKPNLLLHFSKGSGVFNGLIWLINYMGGNYTFFSKHIHLQWEMHPKARLSKRNKRAPLNHPFLLCQLYYLRSTIATHVHPLTPLLKPRIT